MAHHDEIEASMPVRQGSELKWIVEGSWNTKVTAFNQETKETITIWTIEPNPENHEWNFHFSKYGLKLNDIDENYKKKLPATDARLRPDLRAYEEGKIDLAASEKHRLEEKQRAARK